MKSAENNWFSIQPRSNNRASNISLSGKRNEQLVIKKSIDLNS